MKFLTRQKSLFVKVALAVALLFTIQTPLQSLAAPYQSITSYSVYIRTSDVTSADFDNDGHLDIATSSLYSTVSNVSVQLGNGDGTFGASTQYSSGGKAEAIINADINGDGNVDLATANRDYNTVSILLGDGNGGFASALITPVDTSVFSLAAADFNKDGKMDLAVSPSGGGSIRVMLGKGDGTFEPYTYVGVGSVTYQVATGDFNADGNPDFVVCNYGDDTVSVVLGNGDGTFNPKVDYTTGENPRRVVIGDLNKDGSLDLITSNESGTVSILLGNGDGTFNSNVDQSTGGTDPWAVLIGDLTGDGEADVLVSNFNSTFLSIMTGRGDGTFETATTYEISINQVINFVSGNFNGDGVLDVALIREPSSYLFVLLGNSRNADLQDLSLSAGAVLNIPFSAGTLDYTSSVVNSVHEISVTSTVYDPTASVTVQVNGSGMPEVVASGAASNALPLNVGVNKIEVVVTAQDGTTKKKYTVEVTRASRTPSSGGVVTPTLSANANLDGLSLTRGATLGPAFTSNVYSYTSSVANDIDGISIIPTLADGKATVKVRVNGGALEAVTSGSPSGTLPLNVGDNVLDVIVTAEDGTSKSYTISLTRQTEAVTEPQEAICPFTDIDGHWAKAAICEAADLGIVEGVSAITFAPDRTVTRAEFAMMMLRTLEIPIGEESGTLPFSDKESIPDWAVSSISTGVTEGMLNGYLDGTFRPLQTITRSEVAAMIAKVMKWTATTEHYLSYADGTSIAEWARPYVEAVHVRGLMQGRGNNQFVPNGITTRAEAAAMMLRLWNIMK